MKEPMEKKLACDGGRRPELPRGMRVLTYERLKRRAEAGEGMAAECFVT